MIAPTTPLNRSISSERSFAGVTISLSRAKALAKAGVGQVLVVNGRSVALRELTLTSTASPDKSAVVATDLAPGARVVGKLPAKAGCEFSVTGTFDDETTIDLSAVEVCKDRTLNLVE